MDPSSLVIEARIRPVGGFQVRRLLPYMKQRSVGPFVFFDHFGPTRIGPGADADVRPHPHIGLATVTYLFEGATVHRDSLGTVQTITPGAVNWMSAGAGIVHSERMPSDLGPGPHPSHGIQSWVALPRELEQGEPSFHHVAAADLPELVRDGATLRVLAGEAYGMRSPVPVASPTLYVDARLPAGARLELPTDHEERALYPAEGTIEVDGRRIDPGKMIVLPPSHQPRVEALGGEARVMILGGAPLDGPRQMWWNFVASEPELIAAARERWAQRAFPAIPGDDEEFIPLPE